MRILVTAAASLAVVLGAAAVATAEQTGKGDRSETVVSATGTLTAEGRGYRLAGRKLGLGPPRWRAVAKQADYDGDGTVETVAAELTGLTGKSVSATGAADDDGELSVRALNGKAYRAQGKPPWAGGPKRPEKCKAKQRSGGGPPPWAKAHGRRSC